jgi:very-short-patch-repair endonuclease
MENIESNVLSFLNEAKNDYAEIKKKGFLYEMYANFEDFEITSPIEQVFFIACQVLCSAAYTDINPEPFLMNGEMHLGKGIFIQPQAKIGKYKVDFLLKCNNHVPVEFYPDVIVELDGHLFHDKNKEQRAYEKARDRYFVQNGYKVIHYTGSEVVKDPYRVAHEALKMAAAFVGSSIEDYDHENKFGVL